MPPAPVSTLQVAQDSVRFGTSGKTISCPSRLASTLAPSAAAGSAKLIVSPIKNGYECRIMSVTTVRVNSASTKNPTVSDQLSAETLIVREGCDRSLGSILVKGQGPA